MLSSRWTSTNVYRCVGDTKSSYVIASSMENAIKAFEQVTEETALVSYPVYSNEEFMITEEAQAQSELFPNQVRK